MRKYVSISRKTLSERFIWTMFKHPSIEEIADGEYITVPLDKYQDFCHDIGILLGRILQDIAVPYEDN